MTVRTYSNEIFSIIWSRLNFDEFKNHLLEVNKSPNINTFYFKEDKEQKDNMVMDVRNLVEKIKLIILRL